MADQRASCHPSIQLTINFHQKPLKPPRRAIFLLTFYVKYFSEMKSFGHERAEGCSVLLGCFRDTNLLYIERPIFPMLCRLTVYYLTWM